MSSNNRFESGNGSPENSGAESEQSRSGEKTAKELRERLDELEEELAEVKDEVDQPEPDYDCPGEGCEGWAVEELEPEHVEAVEYALGSDRVEEIECPRCGEEMEPIEAGPETERGFISRGITKAAKKGNAKRDMASELKEKGRGEVLS